MRGDLSLSVIVVSYNTRELTLAALRSLERSSVGLMVQTVVVDNASHDDSVNSIRLSFPKAIVLDNDANVGFALAVNQALELATGDYVMLLNPDASLDANAAATLVSFLRDHPDVGVVAPRIDHPQGRLRVLSAGYFPNVQRLLAHMLGLPHIGVLGRHIRGMNLIAGRDDQKPTDVDWVSGACLVTPRSLFTQLNGLSDRWFMYGEDIEFCARVRDMGLRVVHLPSATASHHVGASGAKGSTMWIDSLVDLYVLRVGPNRLTLFVWRLALVSTMSIRACGYLILGLFDHRRRLLWLGEAKKFAAYARRSARARSRGANV